MWNWQRPARLAMGLGLAFMILGETTHPGLLGGHGTQLGASIAFTAAAVGWVGWAITGPRGTSTPQTVFVVLTGLAGSALLYFHPAPQLCWFTVFACIDAGATVTSWIAVPLTAACCAILLTGFAQDRGSALATLAAAAFVGFVIGRGRREVTRAAMLDERGRIAAELHDVLGHSLTALSLQIEAAAAALETRDDRDRALAHLTRAGQLARAGQEETVAAVRTLRDGAVGVHDLARRLIDSSGLSAGLTVRGTPRPLSASTGMAVYRLLQEALTNAGKHAPGSDATVVLCYEPDALTVTVDNAAPVGVDAVSGGLGLPGMRRRIADVGGTLATGPVDGSWHIEARVPA